MCLVAKMLSRPIFHNSAKAAYWAISQKLRERMTLHPILTHKVVVGGLCGDWLWVNQHPHTHMKVKTQIVFGLLLIL
jgi:hypothetical protein